MATIVQKFGGTSVATPQAREALLEHVKKCKEEGNNVVVVVSAMGRTGDPYATDTLIGLLEQISPVIVPKKKDLLMSCGEIISCTLISHLLETNNIPSEALTGSQAGILTNTNFNNSEIINIETATIENYLKDGKVVVIAGFQGTTANGEITTLGRGGSDTTAVALGGYLNATRVDIFTDVAGIAKVDPRIVSTAPYLDSISYDDMYKLAYHGAKVIHPRAVLTAQKYNVPVRIVSTFSDGLGTKISAESTRINHKIFFMALEKEVEICNSVEPIGKLFISFDVTKKNEIEIELQTFFARSNFIVQNVIWNNNSVNIFVASSKLDEFVRSLYSYFHS